MKTCSTINRVLIEKFKLKLKVILTCIPAAVNQFVAYALIKARIMENYQPILQTTGKRISEDRWEKISQNISKDASLCLDIGCNTGYFSNKIARIGIFTIGIDTEIKNIILANTQYSAINLVFKDYNINPESVQYLPNSDVLILLSVFHHLVKYNGQEEAIEMLKIIASKCQKQMFFETGQPDEKGTNWCDKMSFIKDIDVWIKDFFINKCGAKEVLYLGAFETFLTTTKRKLYRIRW